MDTYILDNIRDYRCDTMNEAKQYVAAELNTEIICCILYTKQTGFDEALNQVNNQCLPMNRRKPNAISELNIIQTWW